MALVCLGNKLGRVRVKALTKNVSGSTGNKREDFRILSVFWLIFEVATTSMGLWSVIATPQPLMLSVWDIKRPKFSSSNVVEIGRLKNRMRWETGGRCG
jgi:hypothetical protein